MMGIRSTTSTPMALPHGWVSSISFREDIVQLANRKTATQAAPLIASPTMIVALLSPEVREASSTYTSKVRKHGVR